MTSTSARGSACRRARRQVAAGRELVLQLKVDYSGERWEETSNPRPDLLKASACPLPPPPA